MSIKLMASAWELDIPSTEKMVLLCLCDFSGDGGVCWPSVPTIARKCSKSERTVQVAIQWLRNEGFCSWDETPGKPHRFTLDPRRICTPTPAEVAPLPPQNLHPAKSTPPQVLHETPAESAPKPLSRTIKSSEAKASSPREKFPAPPDVSDEQWEAFKNQRKKPLNARSYLLICNKLAEFAGEGWPPGELIDLATERGWESVFKPFAGKQGSTAKRYVSDSGYEYRGDEKAVMREAERRADWGTYWKVKGEMERAA